MIEDQWFITIYGFYDFLNHNLDRKSILYWDSTLNLWGILNAKIISLIYLDEISLWLILKSHLDPNIDRDRPIKSQNPLPVAILIGSIYATSTH